ncbi:Zwei Ig domain protein zig-8 [Nymphon striatum]|nr:Zwei Ig domain protein zig-8 [Nymphon striatum]
MFGMVVHYVCGFPLLLMSACFNRIDYKVDFIIIKSYLRNEGLCAKNPEFMGVIANITVVEGQDATLNCPIRNLGKFKMAWVKVETKTVLTIHKSVITLDNRFRISHTNTESWFLHIRNVNSNDRGEYMCQVNSIPVLKQSGYLQVHVRSAMHDLANCTTSKQKHSENTATRLKQDEQAVQDIDNCITEFGCDPFNLEKPQLRSLQSGVLASTALVDDFESAHKAGEKLFEKFCNDRMLSDKSSFYSTVHRNSRRNFSNPPPVTGQTNMTITKTEAMENKAMSSIVALAEAHDEKFNLVDVMDYRVTDECLPIYKID